MPLAIQSAQKPEAAAIASAASSLPMLLMGLEPLPSHWETTDEDCLLIRTRSALDQRISSMTCCKRSSSVFTAVFSTLN